MQNNFYFSVILPTAVQQVHGFPRQMREAPLQKQGITHIDGRNGPRHRWLRSLDPKDYEVTVCYENIILF